MRNQKIEHPHNYFEFSIIRNKKEIQHAFAYNIVVDNFRTSSGSSWWYRDHLPEAISLGTGNSPPKTSDRSLDNTVFQGMFDSVRQIANITETDIVEFLFTKEIPPSPSQIWDLKEVGLSYHDGYINSDRRLCSRALIVDMEGNPTTIHKGEFDKLYITGHYFATLNYFTKIENTLNINNRQRYIFSLWPSDYQSFHSPGGGLSVTGFLDPNVGFIPKTDILAFQGGSSGDNGPDPYHYYYRYGTEELNSSADKKNSHYFNMAYFGSDKNTPVQFIPLPNSNIFPITTIKDLEIGIGDGVTQDFTTPIPMFLKDTDKIYKNDILLARGIDYTIDNTNNQIFHPEMMASNFVEKYYSSDQLEWSNYGNDDISLGTYGGSTFCKYSTYNRVLRVGNDIILKLRKDPLVPLKFNSFALKDLKAIRQDGKDYWNSGRYVTLSLWYSDTEDFVWNKVTTISSMRIDSTVMQTFPLIENKYYWKISFDSCSESYYNGLIIQREGYCVFGYIGEGIHFTEPPAEGDILLMDADIDRPWKNNKTILDLTVDTTSELIRHN